MSLFGRLPWRRVNQFCVPSGNDSSACNFNTKPTAFEGPNYYDLFSNMPDKAIVFDLTAHRSIPWIFMPGAWQGALMEVGSQIRFAEK